MRLPGNRRGLRWYLIILGLLAGNTTIPSILWGVPFLLTGITLCLWAKCCLHQNQEVTTSGPYRSVRHPFHLGKALIDSAILVMSGWTLLMCLFPLRWTAVYLPVMRREETATERLFGQDYRAYARRVPKKIEGLSEPGSTVFFYTARGGKHGGPLGMGASVVELNPNYPGKK